MAISEVQIQHRLGAYWTLSHVWWRFITMQLMVSSAVEQCYLNQVRTTRNEFDESTTNKTFINSKLPNWPKPWMQHKFQIIYQYRTLLERLWFLLLPLTFMAFFHNIPQAVFYQKTYVPKRDKWSFLGCPIKSYL